MPLSERTPSPVNPPALIWWAVWAAILSGVVIIYSVAGQGKAPARDAFEGPLRAIPLVPVIVAALIRWLVLPRFTEGRRAFPIFVAGLALAEGSGILGMFLLPSLRTEFCVLGVMGVAQFVPVFIEKYKNSP